MSGAFFNRHLETVGLGWILPNLFVRLYNPECEKLRVQGFFLVQESIKATN